MNTAPQIADAPQRTNPVGLIPTTATNLRQAVVPIIAAYFGVQSADLGVGLGLLGALMVLMIVGLVSSIVWWRTTYTTGADDIRVESGLLSRQARSVPYERIQDVSVEQPLLARLLGLVQLRFETGAGGKDDLSLAYVNEAEGERLRNLVRERREEGAERSPEGAEGGRATVEEEQDEPIFAMSPSRIALFGVFEFSLVVFGVLAAGLQQLDFLLPFDIWEPGEWRERFGGPVGWLIGSGVQAQIVAAALGLVSVALVGIATGLARTFAREYGFTLSRGERGFRRRRGLFTRTDVVMPVHRVQAGIVTTGWLRRLWGWHGLKFVSLAQDAGSTNHDAAPFARMAEIGPIVNEAALSLPPQDTDWHRPVAARWLVGGAWWVLVLVAIGLAVAIEERPGLGLLVPLIGFPLVAIRQWLSWRQYRHAIDARQLYYRSGLFRRKMMIVPRQRIQSVEIKQGPLGRLSGYVDLHFGLPGGRLRFTGVRAGSARTIFHEVAQSIAATDFARASLFSRSK